MKTPAPAVANHIEHQHVPSQTSHHSVALTVQAWTPKGVEQQIETAQSSKQNEKSYKIASQKNKYKYFPTFIPRTWKLLNKPEQHTENHQQQGQQNAAWNQHSGNPINCQNFIEKWQTVRRGRHQAPQVQQDRYRDN
jgi:hypothetical protein